MNWKRGSFERSCLLIAGMVMIVLAATARVTVAQSGGNMERPPHWQVLHPDRNEVVERPFVVMRPGWHIFAGPGALLWDPGSFASGNFSVTSKMFLFPTPEMGTPFGVFLGGSQFEGEWSAYVSFQIRNDGRFRVAHHAGEQVHELVPWTEHAEIVPLEPTGGPVENRLAVDVQDGVVSFFINDAVVAELSDAGLTTDGAIGLAVGGDLSLHVTELLIGPNRPVGAGRDSTPIWSMDRARILFTGSRNGTSDLYVLDRAAGTTRQLTAMGTPEGGANGAQVSPDGTSVAFQVRRGSDYDLYVVDLAGGIPQSVVQHAAYDVNPVWSPDGRRLAFMSTRGFEPGGLGPFPGHIYAVDLALRTVDQLTVAPLTSSLGPSDWSADGASILFARAVGERPDVFLIDLATGLESQLTQSTQGNYSATFSHSGDRIAFHSESDDGAQIVVSDLGGDSQRRVTSGPGFRYSPRWSPDDRWLMFSASDDGRQYDIRAVRIEDGAVVDLVATPEDEREGRWIPAVP